MLFNKNIPYPPQSAVYFIVEDAIRKGVVESVICKLTDNGEERCWVIKEYITETEPVSWDVHDVLLIAHSPNQIMQRAEKSIRPFIVATKKEQETSGDMFA